MTYDAVATWELGVAGDYQKTTIAKQVAVAVRTDASGYDVAFRTAAPVLAKPEGVPALEALALRLAAVYENVVVHAAPTGEFQHLLNHDHLVQTWAALRADLCANIADGDALTPVLLAQVDRELADPARVLRSLAHDYVYRALVSPVYGEVLEATRVYSQAREFSQFFPNASVWFAEQLKTAQDPDLAHVTLTYRGTLDAERTDVPAIGRFMAAALHPGRAPEDPPAAPMPHFGYTATHVLDKASGLPISVALVVYGRLGDLYNKEYTLTIQRI